MLSLELLLLSLVVDFNERLAVSALDNLLTPVEYVLLDERVVELLADHSLGVLDGVEGVLGDLVLGGVADESLFVGECNL